MVYTSNFLLGQENWDSKVVNDESKLFSTCLHSALLLE